MFEGPNNYLGLAVRNHGIAQANASAATRARAIGEQWEAYAHKLERQAEEQADRIAELELRLAQERAGACGYRAQLKAFQAEAPNSPLLADSGKRYADGDMKTVGRLLFEAEFDRIAREEFGIAKPEELRAD